RRRRRPRRGALLVALETPDRARPRAHACHTRSGRGPVRRRDPARAGYGRDLAPLGALPSHGRPAVGGGASETLVPHVGLARVTNAADRDSWTYGGDPRGDRQRPGAGSSVARRDRCRDRSPGAP